MPSEPQNPVNERVLPFNEALRAVLAQASAVSATAREAVPLLESLGRVLADAVHANRDQPPFPRSTRDGFAVKSSDLLNSTRDLTVAGLVRAGECWSGTALESGQAIETMTGAPLPSGADAVLMVEHATCHGDVLKVEEGRVLKPGQNVVPRGAEAHAGQIILPMGRRVGAAEISVAASVGLQAVAVTEKPQVAIIATGDELVELDQVPEDWQIHNSNSYALAALVTAAGGKPDRLPIARDTMDDLRDRIDRGRNADLLLLSGGVSMGKYDLVEQALGEHGAEFIFTGALIQPGKPVVFGRLPARVGSHSGGDQRECYFFGLPGNPVSTQVCFHLFVAPFLRALSGDTDLPPHFVEGRLAEPVKGGAKVTRFLPAELEGDWTGTSVRIVPWQGSGDVTANARGDGYVVLPAGDGDFAAGETVRVLLR